MIRLKSYNQRWEYQAKALIICMGAKLRRLGWIGGSFRGRGVSYCATCDGAFYKDKYTAIVGGGDTAVEMPYSWHSMRGRCILFTGGMPSGLKILPDRLFRIRKSNTLGYGS